MFKRSKFIFLVHINLVIDFWSFSQSTVCKSKCARYAIEERNRFARRAKNSRMRVYRNNYATIDHGNRKVESCIRRNKKGDVSRFPVYPIRGRKTIDRYYHQESRCAETLRRGERRVVAADALLMLVWFQVSLPVGAPGREEDIAREQLPRAGLSHNLKYIGARCLSTSR